MSTARQLLRDLNLPDGDRYDLPTSSQRFPDGGHYRIEIPSVEGPAAMAAVIEAAQPVSYTHLTLPTSDLV